jgi:dTDP-D-glucose 4,6-dehydratase
MPTIYVATDKSFGEQQDCGIETPYRPIYPYDASKACEDLLVESYRSTYGLPAHLLRFPNFYGEGDLHAERLIPSVCLAAVNETELVVRTRLDGSYRQYIYVGDAADIVCRTTAMSLAGEPVWKNSHFGPSDIKSVGDVIADVERIMGAAIAVRVLNQASESSRISLRDENGLDYRYTGWTTGLGRTIAAYRAASGLKR